MSLKSCCRQISRSSNQIRNSKARSRDQSTFSPSTFLDLVARPSSKYQIYISRSLDPFVNLSIEHFLLQKSSPESTILFLYVNGPCVVIGRNQNPWLEVDLRLLNDRPASTTPHGQIQERILGKVDLVRRRSGGGTVFHDEGNVNYSVICPTANFTRDKSAEMVVRAIRIHNPRARVNERHDIVLDQGDLQPRDNDNELEPLNTHKTSYGTEKSLKVSGSAYKLIRQRSLHHGTCLLMSPNLDMISRYLRSPAKPFMKAKGVESVRSPVGNVHGMGERSVEENNSAFQLEVVKEFTCVHGLSEKVMSAFSQVTIEKQAYMDEQCITGYVDNDLAALAEVRDGIEELKSLEWTYGQTPEFILSGYESAEGDRSRPSLAKSLPPPSTRVYIKARGGEITSTNITLTSEQEAMIAKAEDLDGLLKGKKVQEIRNFEEVLGMANLPESNYQISGLSAWLDIMFGKPSGLTHEP